MAKYQKVIDFPVFAAAEDETAARERCRKLWIQCYPRDHFDSLPLMRKLSSGQVYPIEEQSDDEEEDDLVPAIARQSSFYLQVSIELNISYTTDPHARSALQRMVHLRPHRNSYDLYRGR